MADIVLGTTKRGAEFLKQVAEKLAKSKAFGRCMDGVKICDGGNGKCLAEFTVAQEHLNRGATLHGGFTATLIDIDTTLALMSKPSPAGVSVNLSVNYLKTTIEGDVVLVDAQTVHAGKTLAYIECELRHKKDGSVIANGNQTKFVGSAKMESKILPKEQQICNV